MGGAGADVVGVGRACVVTGAPIDTFPSEPKFCDALNIPFTSGPGLPFQISEGRRCDPVRSMFEVQGREGPCLLSLELEVLNA
jgi:hypothetical protein